ncbi:MAG: SMP-30/gluconolactonase/LRE family protein [Planctomycetes bacterium]|nr:SMP-30/gluconolactonase/LRE family protein [Planctomycetota bacterium]
MALTAELVLDAHAALGEGPLWSTREQVLYWVDILAHLVHRYDPKTGENRTCQVDTPVGVVVERARGGLAIGTKRGFAGLDFATARVEPWCHPEADRPQNRLNDGKCDSAGRFWAGSESPDKSGGFHRLDADHRATTMLTGIGCSNGLAWSADDRTLYYIDTFTAEVAAFPFDAKAGTLGARRVAITVDSKEHGWPDGMCIDAEGMLWVGHWGGSRINRWDPRSGKLLATVPLPVSQVTSCAFSGPKLDHLYVTSASTGLSDAERKRQPHAGGLFRIQTGPIGLPSVPFAG